MDTYFRPHLNLSAASSTVLPEAIVSLVFCALFSPGFPLTSLAATFQCPWKAFPPQPAGYQVPSFLYAISWQTMAHKLNLLCCLFS